MPTAEEAQRIQEWYREGKQKGYIDQAPPETRAWIAEGVKKGYLKDESGGSVYPSDKPTPSPDTKSMGSRFTESYAPTAPATAPKVKIVYDDITPNPARAPKAPAEGLLAGGIKKWVKSIFAAAEPAALVPAKDPRAPRGLTYPGLPVAGAVIAPVSNSVRNFAQGALAPGLARMGAREGAPTAGSVLQDIFADVPGNIKAGARAVVNNSGAESIGAQVPSLAPGTTAGDVYNTLTGLGSDPLNFLFAPTKAVIPLSEAIGAARSPLLRSAGTRTRFAAAAEQFAKAAAESGPNVIHKAGQAIERGAVRGAETAGDAVFGRGRFAPKAEGYAVDGPIINKTTGSTIRTAGEESAYARAQKAGRKNPASARGNAPATEAPLSVSVNRGRVIEGKAGSVNAEPQAVVTKPAVGVNRAAVPAGAVDAEAPAPQTVPVQPGDESGVGNGVLQPSRTETPAESGTTAGKTDGEDVLTPARAASPLTGHTGTTYTPVDTPINYRWRVVDAGDLVASQTDTLAENPSYPQELQPRDRNRKASDTQIMGIAQNLNPARLADAPTTADGAPIIGPDNFVESGNGRTLAIRRAYQNHPEQAETYRQSVIDAASQYGIDPSEIAGVRNPVLVRERTSGPDAADLPARAQLAAEMGKPTVAAVSDTEQARADARLLLDNPAALQSYQHGADVLGTANSDFRRAFVSMLPEGERGALQQSDGQLSVPGMRRIRAAMLGAAYDDPHVIARMTEATDDKIKTVGQALEANAPALAQLKQRAGKGELETAYDITPHITAAANALSTVRQTGVTVAQHLAQAGLFDASLSPVGEDLLRLYDTHKRRPQIITDTLAQYARGWNNYGNPKQTDLFGEEKPNARELLAAARRRAEELNGVTETKKTGDLFSQPKTEDAPARASGSDGAPVSSEPRPAEAEAATEETPAREPERDSDKAAARGESKQPDTTNADAVAPAPAAAAEPAKPRAPVKKVLHEDTHESTIVYYSLIDSKLPGGRGLAARVNNAIPEGWKISIDLDPGDVELIRAALEKNDAANRAQHGDTLVGAVRRKFGLPTRPAEAAVPPTSTSTPSSLASPRRSLSNPAASTPAGTPAFYAPAFSVAGPALPRITVAPLPGGKVGEPLSSATLDLSKALGKNIEVSAARKSSAAGVYYPGQARITVRAGNDLDTTAHEVAHALDHATNLVGQWVAQPKGACPFDAELIPNFSEHGSKPAVKLQFPEDAIGERPRLSARNVKDGTELEGPYTIDHSLDPVSGQDIYTVRHKDTGALTGFDRWQDALKYTRAMLAYEGEGLVVTRAEAAAEWVRAYLVNPDAARAAAPLFAAHYEGTVPPALQKAVRAFGDRIRQHHGLPEENQMRAVLQAEKPKEKLLDTIIKQLVNQTDIGTYKTSGLDRLRARITDEFAPIVSGWREIRSATGNTGRFDVLPQDDPILLIRQLQYFRQRYEAILRYGMVNARNEVIGKPFASVYEPLLDGRRLSADALEEESVRGMIVGIADRVIDEARKIDEAAAAHVTELKTRLDDHVEKVVARAEKGINEVRGRRIKDGVRHIEARAKSAIRQRTIALEAQAKADIRVKSALTAADRRAAERLARREYAARIARMKKAIEAGRDSQIAALTARENARAKGLLVQARRSANRAITRGTALRKSERGKARVVRIVREREASRARVIKTSSERQVQAGVIESRDTAEARLARATERLNDAELAREIARGDAAQQKAAALVQFRQDRVNRAKAALAKAEARIRTKEGDAKLALDVREGGRAQNKLARVRETAETAAARKLARTQGRLEAAAGLRKDRLTGAGAGNDSATDIARRYIAHMETAEPDALARYRAFTAALRQQSIDALRYLAEKGRYKTDDIEKIIANGDHYIALKRVMDEAPVSTLPPRPKTAGGAKSLTATEQQIHAFFGSERTIINPVVSTLEQVFAAVKEADRNEILQKLTALVPTDGTMYGAIGPDLTSIATKLTTKEAGSHTIYRDGVPEYWKFEAGIDEAMARIGEVKLPTAFERAAMFPATLLRATATKTPGYLLRNKLRDIQELIFKSRTMNFNTPKGIVRGLKDLTTPSTEETRYLYELLGGGIAKSDLLENAGDFYHTQTMMLRQMGQDNSPFAWAKRIGPAIGAVEESIERSTRIAEFNSAKRVATEAGLDEFNANLFAAGESRDTQDFTKGGTWTKIINRYVAFTNAQVIGLTRLGAPIYEGYQQGGAAGGARGAAKVAAGLMWKGTVLFGGLATIPLMIAKMHGDEELAEYREFPPYLRHAFYLFKFGPNTWAAFPKAHEIGVWGSGVEAAFDFAMGNEAAFEGLGGSAAKNFLPVDSSVVMMGSWKPLVNMIYNYDDFRESPIVSPQENERDLADRPGQRRATRLGQALGGAAGIDARKMDYGISSFLGDYGRVPQVLSDIGRPDRPTVTTQLGRMTLGIVKESPGTNARSVQRAGDLARRAGIQKDLLAPEREAYHEAGTNADRDRTARALRQAAGSGIAEREALKIRTRRSVLNTQTGGPADTEEERHDRTSFSAMMTAATKQIIRQRVLKDFVPGSGKAALDAQVEAALKNTPPDIIEEAGKIARAKSDLVDYAVSLSLVRARPEQRDAVEKKVRRQLMTRYSHYTLPQLTKTLETMKARK